MSKLGTEAAMASNLRWEAEASLNKARRDTMTSLTLWAQVYEKDGNDKDAAMSLAKSHLPDGLLDLVGIER